MLPPDVRHLAISNKIKSKVVPHFFHAMKEKRRKSLRSSGKRIDTNTSSEDSSSHINCSGKETSPSKCSEIFSEEGIIKSPRGTYRLGKTSNEESPISGGSNHKVSPDKVKKSNSPNCSQDKNARKSKEMAGIFSSMQINTGDSIQHNSGHIDEFLPDFEDKNNTNDDVFKFVKDEKVDYLSEDQGQVGLDYESLTSEVGCKNEKEMLWAQRSEYSKEIARMVGPDHPSIPTSYNSMEKSRKKYGGGPVDPNGRYKGRKLVLWHRPRMMEKLLLNIQYECHKAKLRIPWDEIVHRLEPGCSGPSAVQMLNKMRDVLITEGHMIPPAMGNGIQPDPNIRGYVRDFNSKIPAGTRILRWTENYPNASRSLSDSGFVRGSGNYRKVVTRGGAFNRIPRTIEERGHEADIRKARRVIPEEAYSPTTSRIHSQGNDTENSYSHLRRGKPRALWKKPGPKAKVNNAPKTGTSSIYQVSGKVNKDRGIGKTAKDFVDHESQLSDSRAYCKIMTERETTSSEEIHFRESSGLQCGDTSSSNIWPTTEKMGFCPTTDCKLCEVRDENITVYLSPMALEKTNTASPHHSSSSNLLRNQVVDNIGILAHQLQYDNCFVKSDISNPMIKKTYHQTQKPIGEHGNQPNFIKVFPFEPDSRLNSWNYLKSMNDIEKIEEENAVDVTAAPCINDQPLASKKSLDQPILVDEPGTFNVGIPQHYLDSWPNSVATSELQDGLIPANDQISVKYEFKSNQLHQDIIQDTDYSNRDVNSNSFHNYTSKFIRADNNHQKISLQRPENKEHVSYNKDMFRPSQISHDSTQNCHFVSSDVVFDDKITNSIDSVTQPGSLNQEFYGESENTTEDDFQISAWQNDFLSEQHEELSEVFRS